MRKRFNPNDLLPVKARLNQRLVQVGKRFYLFDAHIDVGDNEFVYVPYTIRRRYISDEVADEKIGEKLPRVIRRNYKDNIKLQKEKINAILGDVYVVVPPYPESSITDIIILIEQMQDEPNDVVAVEICKHLKI